MISVKDGDELDEASAEKGLSFDKNQSVSFDELNESDDYRISRTETMQSARL